MTYLFLKVLLVVLMTAAVAVAQKPAVDVSALYSEGLTLLESGKFDEAVAKFQETVAADKNNSAFHYALGLSLYRAGKYRPALESFNRYNELKPGPVADNQIGITLMALERYDEALSHLEKARSLNPDDRVIVQNTGLVLARVGKFKEAIERLERAKSLGQDTAVLHLSLGYAYAKRKKYEKAIEEFRVVARETPGDLSVRYALANLYMAVGNGPAAMTQQRTVAELDPEMGRRLQRQLFSDKVISVDDLSKDR